jgi:hypothetical protein
LGQFRPDSYVKGIYFTSVKKRHLQAAPDNFRKAFPGANPRRGQERKEASGARLVVTRNRTFLSPVGGPDEGGAEQCKLEGRIRPLN